MKVLDESAPLNFAVIGCGSVARGQHIPNIVKSTRMTLHTCVDLDDAILAECKDVFSTVQKEVLYKRETEVGFLGSQVDHVKLDCELPFEEEFVVILTKSHRLGQSANL